MKYFLILTVTMIISQPASAIEVVFRSAQDVTAACPIEDDVWGLQDAIASNDTNTIEQSIVNDGCILVLNDSHGEVVDTSPNNFIKVKINYLYKYQNQTKPELWVNAIYLRKLGTNEEVNRLYFKLKGLE